MVLEHETLWDMVEGCETFESYCQKMVPDFKNDDNIPVEIQRKLAVIQKLVAHAYFEYDFLDVAYLQAFHTLELALYFKHKALNPKKEGKINLNPLLDWAIGKKYITKDKKEVISYLRNRLAHPKGELMFGLSGIDGIKTSVKIICELFTKDVNV